MKKGNGLIICSVMCLTLACAESPGPTLHIANYKGDKACAISYTYDDGMAEHYTLVAPQMEKHGFRGTFWVNGASINEDNENIVNADKATWPQLKEMAEKGHEISNHSWSHPNFKRLTIEQMETEVQKNDSMIYEKTGILPVTFCYPYNAYNDTVLEIASRNRVATRTKQRSIGNKATPDNLEKWVNDLIASAEWGIGMTHGITYGYDAFTSQDILWDHFEKVKAREDSVWVGTFREVASYIEERDNINLEVAKGKKSLQVTPQLSLDKTLFTEPLTMVVEQEGIKKLTVKQDGKTLPVQIYQDKALFDFDPYGGIIEITR